jgi:hypothetical protein
MICVVDVGAKVLKLLVKLRNLKNIALVESELSGVDFCRGWKVIDFGSLKFIWWYVELENLHSYAGGRNEAKSPP